jgi:hypothetical protein
VKVKLKVKVYDMHTPAESPKILSLIEDIKQVALQKHHVSQTGDSHFRLLGLIDQLKLAVETPTETVLRLIYQVDTLLHRSMPAANVNSLRRMQPFAQSSTWASSPCSCKTINPACQPRSWRRTPAQSAI